MVVKYNNINYKVKIIDYLKIKYYKFILWFIRWLRRVKRLFCDYTKPLIPLFVLFFLYIISTYHIGINHHKYSNFFDAIWDSKEFIFFSLFYAYFYLIFTGEKERNKRLKNQADEVATLCHYSNHTMFSILYLININYTQEIFLNEKMKKKYIRYLKENKNIINSHYINKLDDLWINELIKILNTIRDNNKNHYYIMNEYDVKYLDEIFNELVQLTRNMKNKIENSEVITIEIYNEIIKLTNYLFNVCVLLRKFWRQDDYINQKIRNILYYRGTDIEKMDNLKNLI